MSTTLTYGYKLPDAGDRGASFFPDLEDNIQLTNDHTHNGVNSSLLATGSVAITTQSILAAGWVAQGGGTYKQTVTIAASLLYDAIAMDFRITSSKHQIFPTIEKVSSTSYDIYVNDNTIGVTALYST
jgi:hypothetical protein